MKTISQDEPLSNQSKGQRNKRRQHLMRQSTVQMKRISASQKSTFYNARPGLNYRNSKIGQCKTIVTPKNTMQRKQAKTV